MLRRLAAVTVFACAATPAFAEFPFTMEQTADVLSAAARDLDAPILFVTKRCSADVKATCQFGGGGVGGIATGEIGGKTEFVTIIHAADSDVMNTMIAWGLLIAATSPNISNSQRGSLLSGLVKEVSEGREDTAKAKVGKVTYIFSNAGIAGLWFTAESTP